MKIITINKSIRELKAGADRNNSIHRHLEWPPAFSVWTKKMKNQKNKEILVKKIAEKLRGEVTQNNSQKDRDVRLQYKSVAASFADCILRGETPHRYTNVNAAGGKLQRVRIDYLKPDGSYDYIFGSDGLTPSGAENWWTLYVAEFGTEKEKENLPEWLKNLPENCSLTELRDNLVYRGYTSRQIIAVAKRNKKLQQKWLVDNLKRAAIRHSLTNYDDIDKSEMSDVEVRELRREMSRV